MAVQNYGIIPASAIDSINSREKLFAFLKDQLRWQVDPSDTFTYEIKLPGNPPDAVVSRIVPFTSGDPFAIMLVEFSGPMRRADLREILRGIRAKVRTLSAFEGKTTDEFIFICAEMDWKQIRFAHFSDNGVRQPKLSSFGWDTEFTDETRTLRQMNLPMLTMPSTNLLQEYDWHEGRSRWLEAWNVEKVTNAFYKEYSSLFHAAEDIIKGISEEADRRFFTQKLFNRLLFIRFLEKKGWLTFGGRHDYLAALWDDYCKTRTPDSNFYREKLKVLFFAGLNNPGERNLMVINGGGLLMDIIGDVPYLNGGLFDEDEDIDLNRRYPDIIVPDAAVEPLLSGLLYAWNFAVTESTPDDVEVAVDPEMLGKVFEELVTGRHESGSYYTPKPIVSFMSRESLKGYLASALPDEPASGIEDFVDRRESGSLRNPEAVLDALKKVKVCDPACGSGAYLLGMLHELMDLRISLFNARSIDAGTAYHKKLEIIQTNLYGVDLDQFAVNVARLRLWLSLVVEYEGPEPEPLPNLDFKIEQGDSLSEPAPKGGNLDMIRHLQIQDYLHLKSQYLMAHGSEKVGLKCRVLGLKQEIAEWSHAGVVTGGFDWQVEFAEVFTPQQGEISGGFDIILANPPYVRQELIKDQKPILKKVYGSLYCGTADLYVYFYIRALQLLKSGGMLAFISSNKWFRANYGKTLRGHIADTASVLSITDFSDLPVFNATAYPMIFIGKNQKQVINACYTLVKSLDAPYPDVKTVIQESCIMLPPEAICGSDWNLANASSRNLIQKMQASGMPLGAYVEGKIFYGIKTGFNEAFVIDSAKRDELIAADPKSEEIIKSLAVGRDIKKWHIDFQDRWLIVTKIGVDIANYPAIFKHLVRWQPQLEKRCDQGNHWWELRACAYYDSFEDSKIVFPDIAKQSRFTIDNEGLYIEATGFFMHSGEIFLLGILNSQPVLEFYIGINAQIRGGFLRYKRQYVKQIPIPYATPEEKAAISSLVQKCLDAKGVGCEEWEREIDERVAALYGL